MDEGRQVERLQRCINDIVGLLGLPAVWSGGDLQGIVRALLDTLLPLLRLDFAYALVKAGKGNPPLEAASVDPRLVSSEPTTHLARLLSAAVAAHRPLAPVEVRNPVGDGKSRIVEFWLGLERDVGRAVFGAARSDFPTEVETVVLRVAVNLLPVELQRAQVLAERSRAEESHRQYGHLHAENVYLREEL